MMKNTIPEEEKRMIDKLFEMEDVSRGIVQKASTALAEITKYSCCSKFNP